MNRLYRLNIALFGPGLLGTLGKIILNEYVYYQMVFPGRGTASKAAKNVESCLLDRPPARNELVLRLLYVSSLIPGR